MPLAPGRLSTTTGCPSPDEIHAEAAAGRGSGEHDGAVLVPGLHPHEVLVERDGTLCRAAPCRAAGRGTTSERLLKWGQTTVSVALRKLWSDPGFWSFRLDAGKPPSATMFVVLPTDCLFAKLATSERSLYQLSHIHNGLARGEAIEQCGRRTGRRTADHYADPEAHRSRSSHGAAGFPPPLRRWSSGHQS